MGLKKNCKAITRAGKKCKNAAFIDGFCTFHFIFDQKCTDFRVKIRKKQKLIDFYRSKILHLEAEIREIENENPQHS